MRGGSLCYVFLKKQKIIEELTDPPCLRLNFGSSQAIDPRRMLAIHFALSTSPYPSRFCCAPVAPQQRRYQPKKNRLKQELDELVLPPCYISYA